MLICLGITGKKHELYQLKVDVGMLNTRNIFLADVSSISPSSVQKDTNLEPPVEFHSRGLFVFISVLFSILASYISGYRGGTPIYKLYGKGYEK